MRSAWRTLDIVVVAVIAVAFGVIFWGMNAVWSAAEAATTAVPPLKALPYGVWLLPAVLGGLIIRKPGAAVGCELIAATLSAVLGSTWGMTVIWQGLLEGLGAELVFACFLYSSFRLHVAALAGGVAGIVATMFDALYWYPTLSWVTFKLPYVAIGAVSSTLIAGVGGYYLSRALARTGVLDRFPSGRDRELV